MAPRRSSASVLASLVESLGASLPDLADDTCAQIYAELDSYAAISHEALTAAVTRNLTTAMDALRTGVVPHPAQLDGAAQTARERFEAGVPIEEIVRGFRISIALIHERFVDLAVTRHLPAEATVGGVRVMWGVADAFTTRIITAYHALEVDTALRDAQRRVSSVRALLSGEEVDAVTLSVLDPGTPYAAVRCEVTDGTEADAVRRALEASGSTAKASAIVVVDAGQCFGAVATRPEVAGVAVGLGPFGRLDELPRSDRFARQCLHVARQAGRDGVQGVADLGWRLAAVGRPDVWGQYAATFLTPLEAEGEFGSELLAAVRAWLHHGRSIPRAARALTVHANTIRYRLGRFADLTGANFDDPDDVIALTWVTELGAPPDASRL